jgi:hypothetical protein
MKPLHRVYSKKTILAAAAVALALAVGAHEAHAVATNFWAVSGTICNTNPLTTGTPVYNANGIANNSSVGTLPVSCGITTIQGPSLPPVNFTVKVYDRNSNDQVNCTLYTNDSFGGANFTQTRGSGIATNQPNPYSITYTTGGIPTYGADVECTIPVIGSGGVSHVAGIFYGM